MQSGSFAWTLPRQPPRPARLGPQRQSNPSSARTPRCRSDRSRDRPGSVVARSKARRACFASGWNKFRVWLMRWRGRSGIERIMDSSIIVRMQRSWAGAVRGAAAARPERPYHAFDGRGRLAFGQNTSKHNQDVPVYPSTAFALLVRAAHGYGCRLGTSFPTLRRRRFIS